MNIEKLFASGWGAAWVEAALFVILLQLLLLRFAKHDRRQLLVQNTVLATLVVVSSLLGWLLPQLRMHDGASWFAAIAELEASTITERVMTGKVQKAADGGYNGSRCPLGYKYADSQFSVDTATASTVKSVFQSFVDGATMASTYNSRPLVPEVMVDGDKFAVVAERVLPETLIAAEHVPDWLRD